MLTVSPLASASLIAENIALTAPSAAILDSEASEATRDAKSDFFMS